MYDFSRQKTFLVIDNVWDSPSIRGESKTVSPGIFPMRKLLGLPKARDSNYLGEKINPVFSILKSSYEKLQPSELRCLFMDVALYMPFEQHFSSLDTDLLERLCLVHRPEEEEIQDQVQSFLPISKHESSGCYHHLEALI